ncbi:beta-ribofuranosylaminobenzene 5'-phosphate synthase [Methanopyrus kandleri]
MVRVRSVSRIHVTLIDLHGGLGRVDGSVGVTLEGPRIELDVEPTEEGVEVNGEGEIAEKAERAARKVLDLYGIEGGIRIEVVRRYPEHVGLGSGTQTTLSAAVGTLEAHGVEGYDVRELADALGRGGTSGIGVAAFERGGFIVDGGHVFGPDGKEEFKPSAASGEVPPAPVISRLEVPEDWRFVLAIPEVERGAHGDREVDIFKRYCPVPARDVGEICRWILMVMLPAVVEDDPEDFGRAVDAIQDLGFKRVEVGLQHPVIREMMEVARNAGAYGAGLSSFGPTVYAVCDSSSARDVAQELEMYMREEGIGGEVSVSEPRNEGFEVTG